MKPLIEPAVDLRDYPFMPLDVVRLRDSELCSLKDARAFRLAVLSWCASWHQVPAGSLPDDPRVIARLCGYGNSMTSFLSAERAGGLRGWTKAEDGRLYHPVVTEKVQQAWAMKQLQRNRTKKATASRLVQRDVQHNVQRDVVRDVHQGTVKGQLQGQLIAEGGLPLPPIPIADMVDAKTAAAHIAEIAKEDNVDHVAIAEAYVLSRRAKGWKLGDTLVSHWPADLESFYQSAKSNPRFESEWLTWCYQCWNDSDSCICGPDEKNWHRVKLPCGPGVDKSYAARMEYIQEHFA